MSREYGYAGGEPPPPRRRSVLGWLAKRIVFSLVVMAACSAMGIGYLSWRNQGIAGEIARGLEAVADRLDEDDRDGAARTLRGLGSRLEGLDTKSEKYSSRVRDALSRIKEGSAELYEEARRCVGGEEDDGQSAPGPDVGPAPAPGFRATPGVGPEGEAAPSPE